MDQLPWTRIRTDTYYLGHLENLVAEEWNVVLKMRRELATHETSRSTLNVEKASLQRDIALGTERHTHLSVLRAQLERTMEDLFTVEETIENHRDLIAKRMEDNYLPKRMMRDLELNKLESKIGNFFVKKWVRVEQVPDLLAMRIIITQFPRNRTRFFLGPGIDLVILRRFINELELKELKIGVLYEVIDGKVRQITEEEGRDLKFERPKKRSRRGGDEE